jgi:AbrB family looped-hinge helix DNA binding protein
MQTTISITRKWQIHIPKAARKALELTKPGKAEVRVEGNKLIVRPIESRILQLAGKYAKYAKGKKINIDKIRDYIDYSKA